MTDIVSTRHVTLTWTSLSVWRFCGYEGPWALGAGTDRGWFYLRVLGLELSVAW